MAGTGQISFHSGTLFAKDTAGNVLQVATLQEVSFDFKASNKALFGENQFAEAIGRGNTKITGKAKTGRFNGKLLNQVFFSQASGQISTSAKLLALDEVGTVATAAITVANASDFLENLGVYNPTTGVAYTKVASSPAAGQYSVNETTGVYTFNASENSTVLRISYLYESTAAGAGTLAIANQAAGEAPTFRAIFSQRFQSKALTLILNSVVAESLGFAFKNEDFAMPEFGFEAQADSLGAVGSLSMTAF